MSFVEFINKFDAFLWGLPLIIGMVGTGLYLTIQLKGIQFRKLGFSLKNTLGKLFDKSAQDLGEGHITPFQALSTALAATVGTGNIVGVAVAILAGGPGAIFWMWIAALLGMATKFSEVVLAVAYREKTDDGHLVGGPMYYIDKGLGKKGLAKAFALLTGFACFGIGNAVQANSIAGVINANFNVNPKITGIVLVIISTIVIIGGISSISKVTEKLVPVMALLYIIGGIAVLVAHGDQVGPAFLSIFQNAFSGKALVGGGAGATLIAVMRAGISRGVFTNEAGLGSSPIAHATASTDHPVRQGVWGITEVFVDTIVICTLTALVILSSGVHQEGGIEASALVAEAFSHGFTLGRYIVTLGLTLFALSTILGWAYYGESGWYYIFGEKSRIPYRIIYIICVYIGCTLNLDTVWTVANIMNGLMAVPNLIGLIGLSGIVVALVNDFFADPVTIRKGPEDYERLVRTK